MPYYNVVNAYFCYILQPAGSTAFNLASPTIARASVNFLGACHEKSMWEIKEASSIRDSISGKRVISYELNIQGDLILPQTTSQLATFDGIQVVPLIVYAEQAAGARVVIPDNAVNLASVGVVIPAGTIGKIFAPVTLDAELGEEFGTGQVKVMPVKGSVRSEKKNDLVKFSCTIT